MRRSVLKVLASAARGYAMRRFATALATVLLGFMSMGAQSRVAPVAAKNLRIIGHTDLNGHGNGGEGLDLQQYPDGRRILFYAHTAPPTCLTTIDVTDPRSPKVLAQLPTSAPHIRCNSLGVSGTTMVVAQNT